jgi:hypothetical protein
LYVEYGTSVGAAGASGVAVYSLPLAANSKPLFTNSGPIGPLAFDQFGNLFTPPGADQNSIVEYRAPFSAKSAPVTVVTAGPATIPSTDVVYDLGFDPLGNLWVLTDADLRDFSPPINANSLAGSVVNSAGINLTFSPSGTMYAGPMSLHFGTLATIQAYGAFPYTAPPKTLGNVAFGIPMGYFPDGTALVTSTGGNVHGSIPNQIYPPGLEVVSSISASTSVPYIIPYTASQQASLAHTGAVDGNGTAYVLNGNANNALDVFAYPMVQGSTRQFRLSCVPAAGSCMVPLGVYVGP